MKKMTRRWWISLVIQPSFCNIFNYYDIIRYSSTCSAGDELVANMDKIKDNIASDNTNSWFPWWLKVTLTILVAWLLIMWGVIVFFSIKARINSESEDEA